MGRPFMNRLCQRVGERPAVLKAHTNGWIWYPCELSPFCHHQTFSFQGKSAVVSSVSRLFPCARPPAVRRRVSLGIINPVHRVLGRGTPAHVFEESLKRISPLRADRNPAAAVTVVGRILRIMAALNHSMPNVVLRTVAHRVCSNSKPSHLSLKATTTRCASAEQASLLNNHGVSAKAAAQPRKIFGFSSCRFQCREPSEPPLEKRSKPHAGIIDQQEETSPEFKRRILTCQTSQMCS